MMSLPSISALEWKPVGNSLTRFIADVSPVEFFVIRFDPERRPGYQWLVSIRRRDMAIGTLLHGHPDLTTAKAAAQTHIGDDES